MLKIQAALCWWRSDSLVSRMRAWTGSRGLAPVQSQALFPWWVLWKAFPQSFSLWLLVFQFYCDYDLYIKTYIMHLKGIRNSTGSVCR